MLQLHCSSRYRYTTKLRGHCTTRNLVYLITCTNCAKQYVGVTKREFKSRMAEHVRDTRVKIETPVSIHFNEFDHLFENMIFQIIQILPTDPEDDRSTTKRHQCERYLTYQLCSLKPLGTNVFLDKASANFSHFIFWVIMLIFIQNKLKKNLEFMYMRVFGFTIDLVLSVVVSSFV